MPDQRTNELYSVRAVDRAVHLLELLASESDGGASLKELSNRSGLAKATVHRILSTLKRAALVERSPGSERYRLGVRCLQLGQAYLEQIDLRREARPVMERLCADFNETVHLAVLDDRLRVVYVEKLDSEHPVGIMMSRVGRTAPSYCTGLGKALLAARRDDVVALLEESVELRKYTSNTISEPARLRAELDRIRSQGYSIDLEEHELEVRCVAAAIPGPPDFPVAALSITGPVQRMPEELLRGELAVAVVSAATELAARLGGSPEGST